MGENHIHSSARALCERQKAVVMGFSAPRIGAVPCGQARLQETLSGATLLAFLHESPLQPPEALGLSLRTPRLPAFLPAPSPASPSGNSNRAPEGIGDRGLGL